MDIFDQMKISISGVRAHCPEVLSPQVAYAFTRAYSDVLGEGSIVLSGDSRPSGKIIEPAVIQALSDAGRKILYASVIPLPTTQVAILETHSVGGICLTASHNPSEYNGLKFLDHEGIFITEDKIDAIKQKFSAYFESAAQSFSSPSDPMQHIQKSAIEWHIKRLMPYVLPGKRLRVALDAVNAAGSEIIPELLRRMDCDVVPVATNMQKDFPHMPEPTTENLQWTLGELQGKEYDLCVVVDPDADRVLFIDETGAIPSEEYTLPIIAGELIRRGDSGIFSINLSTSRMIEDVVEGSPITISRSKVGEVNVVMDMKEHDSVFGGEGNGGVIDPKIHYGRDSLVGIVYVVNALRRTGKKLSELISDIPEYVMIKDKVSIASLEDIDALYTKLIKAFHGASANTLDGLRLEWNDKWIHMRPSNTEPIFRIYAEAKSREDAETLVNQAKEII